MSSSVFTKIVEYLYTGMVKQFEPENIMEVFEASNMLGLDRLTQLCEKAIQPLLDESNVRNIDY